MCYDCSDSFCDGCREEPEEERDPALTTLEATLPVEEGMTLEEWEERELAHWQAQEDARAKAALEVRFLNQYLSRAVA